MPDRGTPSILTRILADTRTRNATSPTDKPVPDPKTAAGELGPVIDEVRALFHLLKAAAERVHGEGERSAVVLAILSRLRRYRAAHVVRALFRGSALVDRRQREVAGEAARGRSTIHP